MTDQRLPESELSARHLAAYPRPPLGPTDSERLQALMEAYYRLGFPYLGTLGLTATMFALVVTGGDIPQEIALTGMLSLPLIAALWSYPCARKLSFGARFGRTAPATLSFGVGLIMVATAVIVQPFMEGTSAAGQVTSVVMTLLLGTAGFPVLRLVASQHIRNLMPDAGLFLRKSSIVARIESLKDEEGASAGLLGGGP